MLALCGNIVTAWSWFGVNMLGVGLHSYGFMDSAFYALIAFVTLNLILILIGCLPRHTWRSRLATTLVLPDPNSSSAPAPV